ncbi:MAG: FtsX-like permease family protein [bacterium]
MKRFKENSYWPSSDGEIYGAVKDLLYASETAHEVVSYTLGLKRGGIVTYGVEVEKYSETVKSLAKLTLLSVIIYIFLLFAASFGIVNFVTVAISERKAEMGILLVAGCTRWKLFLRFAMHYFLLCVTGAALGFAAAISLNFTILKSLLKYNFNYFNASMEVFIVIFALTILVCFGVCVYAASIIASKPPAELLRSD